MLSRAWRFGAAITARTSTSLSKSILQLDFLKWFQTALLVMMDRSRTFLWIAARGMGKSFLIAIFVVIRCILYPGTKVVITSGTRGQSINVLEKIQTELMPVSPNLRNEIDMGDTKFSGQDAKIMFKNSSYIKVVTASDNARSNRANILIVDEFRMVKKDTIDTVLKKFLTSRRMPPYRDLTPAERKAEYAKEPNKSCFLSSAYFKDHWSYNKMLDTFKLMLDDSKTDFVCGFPYQLSIQEGFFSPKTLKAICSKATLMKSNGAWKWKPCGLVQRTAHSLILTPYQRTAVSVIRCYRISCPHFLAIARR